MNCDPIAKWYRWMEYAVFGGALHHRREAFLFELGDPLRVLVLGDGDGRFLQVFSALYPRAQVDAVEVSARMIELAKARARGVVFHHADAREVTFTEDYDLAVAHFFLDCFTDEDLRAMLPRIQAKQWLISEFRNTRWSWPLLRGLYFFFHVTTGLKTRTLPDHAAVLKGLGYTLGKQHSALGGMAASELWHSKLHAVK